MNNFEKLYKEDKEALVDLLMCRAEYLGGCRSCRFAEYGYPRGFCGEGAEFGEYETVEWLHQEEE